MDIKLSIGKLKTWFGFSLMKFGLELIKGSIPENSRIALMSAIEDSEFVAMNNIQFKTIHANDLMKILDNLNLQYWLWDNRYWYIKIEDLRKFIRKDLLDRISFTYERRDCDNYATVFSSFVNAFLGINSVGIALGAVLDKNTKNLIGYHAWNLIITEENNQVCLYSYEPQNDTLKKVTGKEIDMDWAIYRCDLVIFR